MNRSDYYMHYQSNIELLDLQIAQVKKATQELIGKKDWQERQSIRSASNSKIRKRNPRLYKTLLFFDLFLA